MRDKRLLPHDETLKKAADALLSFNDMVDIGFHGVHAIDAGSEIIGYYEVFERLVNLVQEGSAEAVRRQKLRTDGVSIKPGQHFSLVAKCVSFNACVLDRYVLLPDLSKWHELLKDPRFSELRIIPLNAVNCGAKALALVERLLNEFGAAISRVSHLKRRANMANTSSRRTASIQRVVDLVHKTCDRVEAHFLDLVWANDCRARKTLEDTEEALSYLSNGIRHRGFYSTILAAVLCVEVSESKGVHVTALLLLRGHESESVIDFGRFWSDQCTGGKGGFMHFSDARIASVFSKWSGLQFEELYGAAELRAQHRGSLFLTAAIESFSRNSLMIRARSERKHRQIRILTGDIVRGLNRLSRCAGKVKVEAQS